MKIFNNIFKRLFPQSKMFKQAADDQTLISVFEFGPVINECKL